MISDVSIHQGGVWMADGDKGLNEVSEKETDKVDKLNGKKTSESTEEEKINTEVDEEATESSDKIRELTGWKRYMFMLIAVAGALYHLYILNFNPIDPWIFRSTHIVFGVRSEERRVGNEI